MKLTESIAGLMVPRRSTRSLVSCSRRRATSPRLELLEQRLLLTSNPDTWTGGGKDTNWGDPDNWKAGVPAAGAAVVFPSLSAGQDSPAIISITATDGSSITADVSSITVKGDYEFHGNGNSTDSSQLILDNGTTISTDPGATLAIDENGTFVSDLPLNIAGSTTKSGDGGLIVSTQAINYPNVLTGKLRPITIGTGTVTLGNSTTMGKTLYNVATGTTLVVPQAQNPGIGSLSGNGTVEVGDTGPAKSLSINTPQGESDDFSGLIDGQGGTIIMQGQGSLTVGSIIPSDSGALPLKIESGTLLVSNTADTPSLQVASNATFGGPGTINLDCPATTDLSSGQAAFGAGATFAATLGGTSSGDYTQLNNDDENPDDNGTGVLLTGSDLAVNLAPGYFPAPGDRFTIINLSPQNTTNPYIQGQFSNAPEGATRSFGGVPFLVSYNQDPDNPGNITSVTLIAESFTVGVDSRSSTPSTYGQSVQFDAMVAVPGNNSVVPTGSVQFFDGHPGAGGTALGAAQPLADGEASVSAARLFAIGSPNEIYAVYTATGDAASSTTQDPAAEMIDPATLTITAQTYTKTYDGTTGAAATPTFQVTGLPVGTLFFGDTLTGLAETYGTKDVGTGKVLTVSPGYTLSDGNGGHNYDVQFVANTGGVIDARTLIITAQPNTKVYDGTTGAIAVPTYSGLQPGDTLTGLTETYDTGDVGTGKVLTVSPGYTLSDGNGGHNYNVQFVANTGGVIEPPLTTVLSATTPKAPSKRKSVRVIVLQFSAALTVANAQNLAAYTIVTVPASRKQKSKRLALALATYDPATFTVTLFPLKPLVLNPPLQLTINGALLLDALGRPLDGSDSGQPGSIFGATLRKGGVTVTSVRSGRAVHLSAHADHALSPVASRPGARRLTERL